MIIIALIFAVYLTFTTLLGCDCDCTVCTVYIVHFKGEN